MMDSSAPNSVGSEKTPTHNIRRTDRYSIWSIAVIVLVVLYSLFLNNAQDLLAKTLTKHKSVATGAVTTDTFQQLVIIDSEVKGAYLLKLVASAGLPNIDDQIAATRKSKSGQKSPARSFQDGITNALDDSMDGLRASPDSMYFARRVIILRSVLGVPPLEAVPPTKKKKGLSSPLNAYEATAKEYKELAPQARQQEDYWRSVFSAPTLPKSKLPKMLAELRQHPTLLFYNLIVAQYLYKATGDKEAAHRLDSYLQFRACMSMIGLGVVSFIAFALFLVGVIVWIGVFSTFRRPKPEGEAGPAVISNESRPVGFEKFVTPLPDRIAVADRKLLAGDLLDCFAIYLVSLNGVGVLMGLAFDRIPHPSISRLTDLQLIYLNIGADLLSYVLASGAALLVLLWKSRKAGASLALELGLSTRGAGKNILYGGIGWGASLVFMLVVGQSLAHLLHKLPDPENPALPLLAFAPNTLSRFLLYGLAAVAAPFFEETFFRGVLLNGLLLRFKPVYACLITGFLFGSVHPVGVVEGLSLAALGAIFAWMAYIRKSLAPSMFAHFLQNSFAYLSVYFSFAALFRL